MLYLIHTLITAVLYGLRIVIMQLIDLSFYKKKLLQLLTFSHVTLTNSKKVLFWNSQIKLLYKTLYLSVNPEIIFYFLLFLMTGSYFHLTNTIMNLLGLPLAIFIRLLTKLTFMARILSFQVQLMFGITLTEAFKNFSQTFISYNKIKKILSDAFFSKYWEVNCQLSDILNWCLMISKFCKHYIFPLSPPCCCYFIPNLHIFI